MKLKYFVFFACLVFTGYVHASPQIQQWQSVQNVETLFVAAPELPMIDIAVTFDAGSGRDGELAGLSQLMHSLLNMGSGSHDADAIAEQFEDVGAQFGSNTHLDRSSVTLRSLTDEQLFEQALSTFIAVLTQPSFPDKDFQRLKKQALIAIKDEEQRPGDIASKAFYKAIYADHPYSQPTLGFQESINKIRLNDVKEFHQQYIVAQNALITIVGGVDLKQAKQIAKRIASSLANGVKPVYLIID